MAQEDNQQDNQHKHTPPSPPGTNNPGRPGASEGAEGDVPAGDKVLGNKVMGDQIDARDSRGFVNRPSGPVNQYFGDIKITISAWQEAIWAFIKTHWTFIVVVSVLEVILLFAYLAFRNPYLIPSWLWGLAAVLLILVAWEWYTLRYRLIRLRRSQTAIVATVATVATLCLVLILGSQVWRIGFPRRFGPQTFGIALAQLDEGVYFENGRNAQLITNQIYDRICGALEKDLHQAGKRPCSTDTVQDNSPIFLTRIGVVSDSDAARAQGGRIGADMVIWGQVIPSGQAGVAVRFEVIETLDKAVNPEFPLVLQVTTNSTDIIAQGGELNVAQDVGALKDAIDLQSRLISSFVLGINAYLARDTPKATQYFDQAANTVLAGDKTPGLRISPAGQSLILFYSGRSHSALGDLKVAESWLISATVLNNTEPALPLQLALVYGSLGREQDKALALTRALELVDTWMVTHPDDSKAWYDKGLIQQIRGDNANALFAYRQALTLSSDFLIAYISAGQVAAALGKFAEMEALFGNALELARHSGANPAWAHLNLAMAYQKAKRPELAKAQYQNAISAAPAIDWMYYYYAQFLEDQKEMDAAEENYAKLVGVAQTQRKGWGYGNLAGFYKRGGLLQKALENYQEAVKYSLGDALLHTYLAETYLKLGNSSDARQAYTQALSLDDGLYYTHASYAGALFQWGDFGQAAQEYERALELRPLDGAVMLNLGRTYEALGNIEKAKEIYGRIVQYTGLSEAVVNEAKARLKKLGVTNP